MYISTDDIVQLVLKKVKKWKKNGKSNFSEVKFCPQKRGNRFIKK